MPSGDLFFNGGAVFDLATQKYLGEFSKQVVLTPDALYAYRNGACRAFDAKHVDEAAMTTTRDGQEKATQKPAKTKQTYQALGSRGSSAACKVPPVEAIIKAGTRLYVGGADKVDGRSMSIRRRMR